MSKKRFILVGRHAPDGLVELGIEVVEQRAVVFPPDGVEAWCVFVQLVNYAHANNAGVLLQNIPAPLGEALMKHAAAELGVPVGIVVSEPGKRPPESEQKFEFPDAPSASLAADMLAWANPLAKVEASGDVVTVRVASPMRFMLHHVTIYDGVGGKEVLYP